MNIKNKLTHVWDIYRPFKVPILFLIFLSFFIELLSLTAPFFYGRVIDGLIRGNPPSELLKYAFILFGVLVSQQSLLHLHGRNHVGRIAFDVEQRTSEVTLNRIQKLSLGQLLNHNSGFKHDVIKKGEQAIMEMVDTVFFQLLPSLMKLVVAIAGLFYLSGIIGTVTFFSIIAYIGAALWINKRLLPEMKRNNRMSNKLGTEYWEIIKHLRLVILNSQEDKTVKDYTSSFREYSNDGKKLWFKYFKLVTFIREPFSSLGQFSVMVIGIYLVSSKKVSPGDLVVAMAWSIAAFQSIGNVGSLHRRLARNAVAIGRYHELLDIPPAITVIKNPIRPARIKGRIEFKNVSFKYPKYKASYDDELDKVQNVSPDEGGTALDGVSFVIEPGTVCAVVGHSGAGKSTQLNLLMRGYDPDQGQILIDEHDLRLLDLSLWRKSVGYVEQEPKLWDKTLGENMTYGLNGKAQSFTTEDLERLAKQTRIDEFYSRLGPERFNTLIGENGVQLSGGQRQRVAIARAIAKSPSVLIFDEATNSLDPMNEQLIHGAIREALVGRTGIIIAHRLSTIRHADQIIVFEKGRIVGNGKHEKLMQTCPAYQAMVEREVGTLAV